MERERAFTLPELVVMAGVVAVFLFLFMAEVGDARHRPKQDRINCMNNLKNLSLAERIFLTDNPQYGLGNTTALTASEFFRSITNELSSAPRTLLCPADSRMEAKDFSTLSNQNVSYFVGPFARTNHLNSFFAGDRNLQTNGVPVPSGSIHNVARSLDLGWTREMHNQRGNIARNDGSVQQFDSKRLRRFQAPAGSTNLLLIP